MLWTTRPRSFRPESHTFFLEFSLYIDIFYSTQCEKTCHIYPKYWDTLSMYHIWSKIWNNLFYYLLMCLKYWYIYGKQYRPWSDAAFCDVCSGSTLFAKTYLSQYLGLFEVSSDMCARQRLKSACMSAHSDQILSCLHEETLHPWLSKMCQMKILIRMHNCTGWSESLLSAHIWRYVFRCMHSTELYLS